jgi:hypothetical protein
MEAYNGAMEAHCGGVEAHHGSVELSIVPWRLTRTVTKRKITVPDLVLIAAKYGSSSSGSDSVSSSAHCPTEAISIDFFSQIPLSQKITLSQVLLTQIFPGASR